MNKPKITFGAIKLNVSAPKKEDDTQPETSGGGKEFINFISLKFYSS